MELLRNLVLLLLLAIHVSGAPHKTAQRTVQIQTSSLKDEMKAMMDDDDDDDLNDDGQKTGFLQAGSGDDSTAQYMADSASGLTAALGPRWNGQELEKDAKDKTKAFLDGIAKESDMMREEGCARRFLRDIAAIYGDKEPKELEARLQELLVYLGNQYPGTVSVAARLNKGSRGLEVPSGLGLLFSIHSRLHHGLLHVIERDRI